MKNNLTGPIIISILVIVAFAVWLYVPFTFKRYDSQGKLISEITYLQGKQVTAQMFYGDQATVSSNLIYDASGQKRYKDTFSSKGQGL